jgi:hypothetical protein
VGPKQILPVTPTRYGHCVAVKCYDNFEIFEQNRPPVFVMTILEVKKYLTNDRRTRLWLCAAAEVSLTEQKKTGDSVVLFVATTITSKLHFI